MESVARSLDKLATCRALVVGDVMLDRYWFGGVDRISPEAPVPVVAVSDSEERLGGAGNVACNITALGASCTLLSVIGDDEAGRKVREIAEGAGVQHRFTVDETGQTTIKLRVISRNQQLLRADFEAFPGHHVAADTVAGFESLLDEHDVVVLSDYGKGTLEAVEKLVELARGKGLPVLVDPKGDDFSRYRGASMVTPNLAEFEAVAGRVSDDDDLASRAASLMEGHDLERLLVTLSERGMMLFSRDRQPLHREARAREVYDVSGAGDTVIAVLALAAAAGLDDETGLTLANGAAGLVVSKLGAAVATREELETVLDRDMKS